MANLQSQATDDLVQLVSFRLDDGILGIDILRVQEINRMVEITSVPEAPHFCEGVMNLRGKVIPVIDLRKKFELVQAERDKNTRIVVCDIKGVVIGIIVDAVDEVLRIPASMIEPAPKVATTIKSDYIQGVAKLDDRMLIFLDIDKLAGEMGEKNTEDACVEV